MTNVTDEMFQVPIHVREIRPTNLDIQGNVHLEAGDQIGFQELTVVNDHDLLDLLRDHLIADESFVVADAGEHEWVPSTVGEPMKLKSAAGDERLVENLRLVYTLAERHFFGYLSDVRQAMLLRDELKRTSRILISAESLMTDYVTDFSEFGAADDLPVEPFLTHGERCRGSRSGLGHADGTANPDRS